MLAKSSRGAGLPLGVCEELSAAAPWMDKAALTLVASLLASREGQAAIIETCCDLDALVSTQRISSKSEAGPLATALAAARGMGVAAVGHELQVQHAPPSPSAGPLFVGRASWEKLEGFAANTYVPASEGSRDRGAGAGEIDND